MPAAMPNDQRRLQLQVRIVLCQLRLVDRDKRVLLFLGIDVLDEAALDQIFKGELAVPHLVDVVTGDHGLAVLNNYQRASGPAHVGVYDHFIGELVIRNVDLVRDDALPSLFAYVLYQLDRALVGPHERAVHEYSGFHDYTALHSGCTPVSSRIFFIDSLSSTPVESSTDMAKFFTRPQLGPSGVSEGQMRPHWVACKSRASK